MTTDTQTVYPDKWLQLLRHAVGGSNQRSRNKIGFRNYFCSEIGSDDHYHWLDMVGEGLASEGVKINSGRDQYFHVTLAGCKAINMTLAGRKRALRKSNAADVR